MGMASLKNYEIAVLVVLEADNHGFSIRVSDCSITVYLDLSY